MCEKCHGCGWVCENHPDRPWGGLVPGGCECGAGMPCECNPCAILPDGDAVMESN